MTPARPMALVTGASSGLGAEFARQLAARGYDLILTARRRDRMEALAATLPSSCEILEADLAAESPLRRVEERLAAEPRLDLLVNNAGFGARGLFHDVDRETLDRMHRVHVTATLRLTHAALGPMIRRDRGAIINVSSAAAFGRSAGRVAYGASKAWINAFTEGLDLELRTAGSHVHVQALCPGFTHTEFHDVLGVDRSAIAKGLWLQADDVVRASLDALDQGNWLVVPGWKYKLFAAVFPKLPMSLRSRLQKKAPIGKGGASKAQGAA